MYDLYSTIYSKIFRITEHERPFPDAICATVIPSSVHCIWSPYNM